MISSGGRANARKPAIHIFDLSGADVVKCSLEVSASEEAGRHEGYCTSECGEEDRSLVAYRWMIGRR